MVLWTDGRKTHRRPVQVHAAEGSTVIRAFGYNPETLILAIVFEHSPKKVFYYEPVTIEEYRSFAECCSKGKHFAKYIRDNKKYTVNSEHIREVKHD